MKPKGITATGWPAVRETCRTIEIEFDEWQHGAGKLILAKRADGLYASDLVVISIPRQVGKTFLIGAIVFALCIITPGTTVVWTAHRFKTARETFAALKGMATRPVMARHVDPDAIYSGAGNESIGFRNGSRIVFGARERGAGRGVPNVAVVVLDEAQILSSNALADLVPTTNTAANPLIFLTGTPPRPIDPGEAFSMLRREALDGESEDTLYVEFSADPDADPLDRRQWAKANPSYPTRTSARAVLRMKKALLPDDFVREALGVWDEDREVDQDHDDRIDLETWDALGDENADLEDGSTVTLAVAVSRDRKWSTIGVCGRATNGNRLVLVQSKPRTAWLVGTLKELVERHNVLEIALRPGSAEGSLLTDLRDADLEVHEVTAREEHNATGALIDAVDEGRIVHTKQTQLDAAVGSARTRFVGAAQEWDGRTSIDVSPIRAVTIAAHRFAELDGDDYDPLSSVLL